MSPLSDLLPVLGAQDLSSSRESIGRRRASNFNQASTFDITFPAQSKLLAHWLVVTYPKIVW
jgi:hypothetical protein